MTYSIQAHPNVNHLARIDAQASIIFDANAPIATPPIFNTVRYTYFPKSLYQTIIIFSKIDNEYPAANLTISDELLEGGIMAVDISKRDSGSGVKEVDIYKVTPGWSTAI